MNLRPKPRHLIVELNDTAHASTTRGGLHVPATAIRYKHRQLRKGRVVAVGEKVPAELVKEGEDAVFKNQAGYMIPEWPGYDHREGDLRMLHMDEIEAAAAPGADIEGRHTEPEDTHQWFQRKWLEPHAPAADDVVSED